MTMPESPQSRPTSGRQPTGRRSPAAGESVAGSKPKPDYRSGSARAEQIDNQQNHRDERPPRLPAEPVSVRQDEARRRVVELSEGFQTSKRTVEMLSQHLGDKNDEIVDLEERLASVEVQLRRLRVETDLNKPVLLSDFEQVSGALIRIAVITALGGLVGAPLLAMITNAVLKEALMESTVAAFTAAVSTEVANRFADPASHKHHG